MKSFLAFLHRLFPFFFKDTPTEPSKAPTSDAVQVVATPVAKTPEVVPQPVLSGPILGPATLALTGPITGNGPVATGTIPANTDGNVLLPGVNHRFDPGTSNYILPQ